VHPLRTPIPVALRRLGRLACLTALVAGCYWSVRLAWADYLFRCDTETALARAVAFTPGNAEYHARLAALRQGAGRGEAAIEPELRAAVQENPRMSSAWIELGLRAETAGEMTQAERDLVRAAQGDHRSAGGRASRFRLTPAMSGSLASASRRPEPMQLRRSRRF
jgi:hypothetical protein